MLVTQSCLTLGSPMGYSTPCSSVQGILQARILEWIAIPFCRGSSRPRNWTQISCIAGTFFIIWATGKPLIIQVSPKCNHKCLWWGREREIPHWTGGENNVTTKAEWKCEKCWQPQAAGRRKEQILPSVSGGSTAPWHLDFSPVILTSDFWPSKQERINFCCFNAMKFVVMC